MDNSKKIIIILIIVIAILVVALIGTIMYIFADQYKFSPNQIVVNTDNKIEDNIENRTTGEEEYIESLDNTAIEVANANLEEYEGINISSSTIKALFDKVESNNKTTQEHSINFNDEGITTKEQVEEGKNYNVELLYNEEGYIDEIKITEYNETGETPNNNSNDIEKLKFNTKFVEYLGEIRGTQLIQLLQIAQESNVSYPTHQIGLTSGNLTSLEGIQETDIYIITLSYSTEGYVNTINIDKKV